MLANSDNPGPGAGKAPVTPRCLLEVKHLSDPRIHPDGERVAFVVTEADWEESRWVSHIWLTEWPAPEQAPEAQAAGSQEPGSDAGFGSGAAAGAADQDPADEPLPPEDWTRQLTFSRDGETRPLWSPDGRYLAFLSAREDPLEPRQEEPIETPREQVWVMPMDGGEARRVTSLAEGVLDFAWGPDSRSLAALGPEPLPQPAAGARREEQQRHSDAEAEGQQRRRGCIWLVDVEDRRPRLAHTADRGACELAISPDGASLCYVTNRTGDPNDYHRADLVRVDLSTGAAKVICGRPGGKYRPIYSPDGKRIAFLSWKDADVSFSLETLFAVDASPAEGQEAAAPEMLLPETDLDIEAYGWTAEGAIAALAQWRAGSRLFFLQGDSPVEPPLDPAQTRYDLACDPGGRRLVWVEEGPRLLPEIVLMDDEGACHTLTALNQALLDRHAWPRQELVQWRSADGVLVEGTLTLPYEHRPQPWALLVQLHGGPKGRVSSTLQGYSMHSAWAALGVAVFQPNYRGSSGYGDAFCRAAFRDLGGRDYQDVMTGVDFLIQRGAAQAGALAMMGGSYGGYLTNWIISQTDRFAAAISLFGIFDLRTDAGTSELSRWDHDYLGAHPWEDPDAYARLSPATFSNDIRTPVLVIHGEEDPNTSIANSRQLFSTLKQRGVPVEFVRYPREEHGVSEPYHKLDEMRRCVAWVRRFLGPAASSLGYVEGERVPSVDGALELCVRKAQTVDLRGEDADEAGEAQANALEVLLTIEQAEGACAPAVVELQVQACSMRAWDSSGRAETGVRPLGVMLDLYGGRGLVQGSGLSVRHLPDPVSGRGALAAALAFETPPGAGAGLLSVPGFPEVCVAWSVPEEGR